MMVAMNTSAPESKIKDIATALGSVQRTLIIRGGKDPLVSEEWVGRLARSFPAASVVTVPGAPHGLPYSAVGPFVEAVHDFVDEVARAWREDERPAGVREPDQRRG